ncbi:MAG TPA: hypothetical protein PK140_00120 [Polyangiaceae bacterium]|jgi:hypothetical protein|nr:MAG: hypothetical protein BWY17_00109 [Deltaproteobacteria bacterium ADurb.Bin207]HPB95017.1 hypothetical protein [Polyangiaceae bacterium]HPY21083.1 hypothetical protein [Polyangiaceae bacterium]HQB42826.1 hypothetical protein [Polyangiaceae bacterium]HQM07764.1 hypothetical protein [Polyangiaceae bacterium]
MRERKKKSWREIDQMRDGSAHRQRERDQERESIARANAATKQYRNALEALFSPKAAEENQPVLPKTAARIVLPPVPEADPNHAERRRLLGKFLAATGPASISKAADMFFAAGFSLPEDQETHVQMLEHLDEKRVRDSIAKLVTIFAGEVPRRRPIVEQRLRRIEEQADEHDTRVAAASLRRMLHGRGTGSPSSTSI